MLNILYVDQNPLPGILIRAASLAGTEVSVHVARTVKDAQDWLILITDIDAVFICYEMRGGVNTVGSGLVSEFLANGFGTPEKPLVAFNRDPDDNHRMVVHGCNGNCCHACIDEFFWDWLAADAEAD